MQVRLQGSVLLILWAWLWANSRRATSAILVLSSGSMTFFVTALFISVDVTVGNQFIQNLPVYQLISESSV